MSDVKKPTRAGGPMVMLFLRGGPVIGRPELTEDPPVAHAGSPSGTWLERLAKPGEGAPIDGLVPLSGHEQSPADPALTGLMEEARRYGPDYVFFRSATPTEPAVAEALVYVDDDFTDEEFAKKHRRLWSWGRVALVYRKKNGRVDLLRCAHRPDFVAPDGRMRYFAFRTLNLLSDVNDLSEWWNASMLRDGSLWDSPQACSQLLSSDGAAQHALVQAIADLDRDLRDANFLPQALSRRLLVLSLLIAYLEDRQVLEAEDFARCKDGALRFFDVLSDGRDLCALLDILGHRFNGDVFVLSADERAQVVGSNLARFAELIRGRTERSGQMSLWQLYSFQDLPVELISRVYQHFVKEDAGAVYTPPFLVRLLVTEVLSWRRLDVMTARADAVLDPSCGSGAFLVEAYKRLIVHWRSTHGWAHPDVHTLRQLLGRVRGVDINRDAVELAAFSLCLAMCEALDVPTLKTSSRLFPKLRGSSLHEGSFFVIKRNGLLGDDIGVVIGNPPFESKLTTPGAQESYESYRRDHGTLPDKQVAYLFLHESLSLLRAGGVLCLLQQYNFLYNLKAKTFRRHLFERWDVREVLDFVSIRGMFSAADTKVIALIVEAQPAPPGRLLLHATFRRTGRVVAQRGFDIDYYDQHWLPRHQVLDNPTVWRSNLVGGGRVVDFVTRLSLLPSLETYAAEHGWVFGEGFTVGGSRTNKRSSDHVVGKRYLPSQALSENGIDREQITTVASGPIEEPRSKAHFSAPMLLIREHMDLPNDLVASGYLTYPDQIVGLCAPSTDMALLRGVKARLDEEIDPLRAYIAATSSKVQKATAVTSADIKGLPFPPSGTLDLSTNERIVVKDIVDYFRGSFDLARTRACFERPARATSYSSLAKSTLLR